MTAEEAAAVATITTMAAMAAVAAAVAAVFAIAAVAAITMMPATMAAAAIAITSAAAAVEEQAICLGLLLAANEGNAHEGEKQGHTKYDNAIHPNPPVTNRYRKLKPLKMPSITPHPTARRPGSVDATYDPASTGRKPLARVLLETLADWEDCIGSAG